MEKELGGICPLNTYYIPGTGENILYTLYPF